MAIIFKSNLCVSLFQISLSFDKKIGKHFNLRKKKRIKPESSERTLRETRLLVDQLTHFQGTTCEWLCPRGANPAPPPTPNVNPISVGTILSKEIERFMQKTKRGPKAFANNLK